MEPAAQHGSSPDSLLEGTGFEPSVPPRKRRPSREAPRPTIALAHEGGPRRVENNPRLGAPARRVVVSRDDLCLMTPHPAYRVRHLSSATANRPLTRAGPMVRIRLPPAESLRTIGSVTASPTTIMGRC